MKRTFKKAAACALALTLVFGAAAANVTAGGFDGVVISASAVTTYNWSTDSGSFTVTELDKPTYSYGNGSGEWGISDNNTTLTITGTGSTPFFSGDSGLWHQYQGTVKKIIVGDGITRLNARCFQGFTALTTVELPNSLGAIGYAAFDRCSALEKITIPQKVTTIEIAAFSHGNPNFEIELSDKNQIIEKLNNAFYSTSQGDQSINLDDIAVISGVTLTNETINYYLDMFPNAEVGGTIRITPSMQLSADGSRFTIKGYVPLTTKRTIGNYSVTLGSTTPSLTESGSQGTFTVACAAKEMADTKELNILYNGKNGFSRPEFSVSSYLNNAIINSTESSISDSTKTVAKSMLRYGAAAQTYFNHNTSNLANAGIEGYSLENSLSDVSPECTNAFTKAAMTGALETLGVKNYFEGYSGINMTFTADTTLMLGFKYSETGLANKDAANSALATNIRDMLTNDCGVTRDDVTVETDDSEKYAVVRVKNVPLMKLDTPIFKIGSVNVCATQYLVQAANSNGTSTELKNLCKALYAFYSDAKSVNAASVN